MSLLRSKSLHRIASNYTRMLLTLFLGVYLIRLMVGFGEDVYAVFVVVLAVVAISTIAKEVVRGATVPELGLAFHGESRERFIGIYNSAIGLSCLFATSTVVVSGLFIIFFQSFNVAPDLVAPARILIATRIVQTVFAVVMAPIVNMLPVTGRMASYNFWIAAERAAEVTSAALVVHFLGDLGNAEKLEAFALFSFVAMCATTAGAALHGMSIDRDFRPSPRKMSRALMRRIAGSIGWNAAAVVSVNLYLRLDTFLVNLLYGTFGTVVFGIASQIASYGRVATMGIIAGTDAIIARKFSSGGENANQLIRDFNNRMFGLQAAGIFGIASVIFLHDRLLLETLFQTKLTDPAATIPQVMVSLKLLVLGLLFQSLSESWMSMLAGTRRIGAYAPYVLTGAMLNPFLVLVLHNLLPSGLDIHSAAIAFVILNFLMHSVLLSFITARVLEISVFELLRPGFLPLAAAVAAFSISLAGRAFISGDLPQLAFTLVVHAALLGAIFIRAFIAVNRIEEH